MVRNNSINLSDSVKQSWSYYDASVTDFAGYRFSDFWEWNSAFVDIYNLQNTELCKCAASSNRGDYRVQIERHTTGVRCCAMKAVNKARCHESEVLSITTYNAQWGRFISDEVWSWFPDGHVATDTIRLNPARIRHRYCIANPTVSTEPCLITSLKSDFV